MRGGGGAALAEARAGVRQRARAARADACGRRERRPSGRRAGNAARRTSAGMTAATSARLSTLALRTPQISSRESTSKTGSRRCAETDAEVGGEVGGEMGGEMRWEERWEASGEERWEERWEEKWETGRGMTTCTESASPTTEQSEPIFIAAALRTRKTGSSASETISGSTNWQQRSLPTVAASAPSSCVATTRFSSTSLSCARHSTAVSTCTARHGTARCRHNQRRGGAWRRRWALVGRGSD